MVSRISLALVSILLVLSSCQINASDWTRFRGPNGSGISSDTEEIPTTWGENENLKWKAELAGPGASSPIVVGDRIFLTCWSGYADGEDQGSLENLKRHLVCIDRTSGKELWNQSVNATLPEESYRGMFAENGYATHTPASDGKIVVVFFGKSGVHAFDMEGNRLWQAEVGTQLDQRGWGTASSPILYKNLVIVPATVESNAMVALDRETGKQVWKQEADGFASTWGTPILVDTGERTELVIGVPYEIWALNPLTGKLLWYCESINANSMCSSVVYSDGVIYAIESGPGGGGAVAVRPGGKGDVTDTHVVWTKNERSRIGSPVVHDGKFYYVNSGVANCLNAKTGESIYSKRLSGSSSTSSGSRSSGGSRRGGRGQDYSSPIIANGKLIYARRSGDVFVVKAGEEFEQLATNRFASSKGDFHATPAVSGGELFIRSSQTLYCVAGSNSKPTE